LKKPGPIGFLQVERKLKIKHPMSQNLLIVVTNPKKGEDLKKKKKTRRKEGERKIEKCVLKYKLRGEKAKGKFD